MQPNSMQSASSPFQQPMATNSSITKSKFNIKKLVFPIIIVVAFVLQGLTIYLVANPPYLAQQNLVRQIMDEVSQKVEVNPFEVPTVRVVADADSLREANAIQKEVYANANDGDYVLGYSDKMVIYRRETGEVVYEGASPGKILNDNQQKLTEAVTKAVTAANLVKEGEIGTPQLSVITDPELLRKQDADFYAGAEKGDIIAIFPNKQLIALIRADEDSARVIQSGAYTTDITKN